MPNLTTPPAQSNIKQFYLPSTADLPKEEQAWVKMDVGQNLVGDLESYNDDDPNRIVRGLRTLTHRIKDWNLNEYDSDKLADITIESVARLNPSDINYLLTVKVDSGVSPLSEEKKSS